jgi:hypothetical protein
MTLVIADTKAQADYWINQLKLDNARFLSRSENILGLSRGVKIVAVGTYKEKVTMELVHDLRSYGYSVVYDPRTA